MSERELFVAALQIADPQERSTWLDHACGGDAALRQRIDVLLQALDKAGSLLDNPVVDPQVPLGETGPREAAGNTSSSADVGQEPLHEGPGAEKAGVVLAGRYKLVEQIGEGGMGSVWMAQQTEPVKRAVAVKLIKLGMDSRQVLARFEAERQALALMDHPNIARVLDGGTAENGRPFFVMELVKGVPLTKYCDEHRLMPRQRLELFVSVCQAVQHAHQKGIIHRDLKPSNILVAQYDGRPVPKVIDFGIAKAAGQQLTDKTLMTGFGAVVGTLEYMSPEQAETNQLDVDTRSDIYSLGVVLYELLTGSTPLDRKRLKQAALAELLRIIREEEPQKPSTRLSSSADSLPSISAQRQMEPAKLTKLMRGELDWIVMKALEKDRNRRYETANGLVMDVQRYLADEPVQACPPSAWYRVRKFMRRHKGRVTAAVMMLVLLLAGTAVSIWQAVRATHAEHRTQTALEQVTAAQAQTREALDTLTDDVMETLFSRQSEFGEKEKEFLRKVLGFYEAFTRQSAETAEARFLRAKGYYQVAHFSGMLGEHSSSEAAYRQAGALLEQLAAEFPDEADYRHKLARTEHGLGIELAKQGKPADAETAFQRGIALRTKLVEDSPKALDNRLELASNYHDLAVLRELQRNYAEAEENYRHALDLREKLVAEAGDVSRYHLGLSRSRTSLGQLLRKQQKYPESEKIFRQAVKALEEQIGKGPATAKQREWLADAYIGLGIALTELKKPQEGEDALRRALEVRRKLVEDFPGVLDHRRALANGTNDLAYFLMRQGKDAEAEGPFRQALELKKLIVKQAGPVPAYRQAVAGAYSNLARVLSATDQPKEAESNWRAALEIWQQLAVEVPEHPEIQDGLGVTLTLLAKLHNQRREFDDAAALLDKARSHLQAALKRGPKHHDFRENYRDYLVVLGQSRLGLADHVRLAVTADELARFGFEPAKDSYDAAGLLSRCAMLADKDAKLDAAKRKELAQRYADQALALLRQAVERGFKDAGQMKKDPNLEPLRTREEFKKLLADLDGKTKP